MSNFSKYMSFLPVGLLGSSWRGYQPKIDTKEEKRLTKNRLKKKRLKKISNKSRRINKRK